MKRQAGRPATENGVPVGHDSLKGKSRELLAAESVDSNTQIQRYIRLTELLPDLLDMVDEGRIAFRPAVELSYLTQEEQQSLLETISYEDATPSLAQAIKMKAFSRDSKLSEDVILSIMHDVLQAQEESDAVMYSVWREYLITLALIFSVPLVFKLLMREAYVTMKKTKYLAVLCAVICLITALSVSASAAGSVTDQMAANSAAWHIANAAGDTKTCEALHALRRCPPRWNEQSAVPHLQG